MQTVMAVNVPFEIYSFRNCWDFFLSLFFFFWILIQFSIELMKGIDNRGIIRSSFRLKMLFEMLRKDYSELKDLKMNGNGYLNYLLE